MEKLNENQINEGVVYLSNGVGLPHPYYVFKQGNQRGGVNT